jgi:hypothetical protein
MIKYDKQFARRQWRELVKEQRKARVPFIKFRVFTGRTKN